MRCFGLYVRFFKGGLVGEWIKFRFRGVVAVGRYLVERLFGSEGLDRSLVFYFGVFWI